MEEIQTKRCSGCGENKALDSFYKSTKESFGVRNICKECSTAYTIKWRAENPGRAAAAKRDRHKKNPEKGRQAAREYWSNNKEKEKERQKIYKTENREAYLETARKSVAKRRGTAQGKLADNVSRAIRHRLVGDKGGRKTFDVLGYTVEALRDHLERQFKPGMTWENYGDWHIDHVIPASVFNYETVEDADFRSCWALCNLQPLWASENQSKKDKLDRPFQPSLMLMVTNDNQSGQGTSRQAS